MLLDSKSTQRQTLNTFFFLFCNRPAAFGLMRLPACSPKPVDPNLCHLTPQACIYRSASVELRRRGAVAASWGCSSLPAAAVTLPSLPTATIGWTSSVDAAPALVPVAVALHFHLFLFKEN